MTSHALTTGPSAPGIVLAEPVRVRTLVIPNGGPGDGASAARDAAVDPIRGVFVTGRNCHCQGIRRFLASQCGARNALSYTKRRCVRFGDSLVALALVGKGLVLIGGRTGRQPLGRAGWGPGTWLAPSPNQQIDFGTINGPRH